MTLLSRSTLFLQTPTAFQWDTTVLVVHPNTISDNNGIKVYIDYTALTVASDISDLLEYKNT